jgi:hypothetical protein
MKKNNLHLMHGHRNEAIIHQLKGMGQKRKNLNSNRWTSPPAGTSSCHHKKVTISRMSTGPPAAWRMRKKILGFVAEDSNKSSAALRAA